MLSFCLITFIFCLEQGKLLKDNKFHLDLVTFMGVEGTFMGETATSLG